MPELLALAFVAILTTMEFAHAQANYALEMQATFGPTNSEYVRITPHSSASVSADGSLMLQAEETSARALQQERVVSSHETPMPSRMIRTAQQISSQLTVRSPGMNQDAKVGEHCISDLDCESSTCDTHGVYGCHTKCVVREADWQKTAFFNCPPPAGVLECKDPTYPHYAIISGIQYCYSSLQFATVKSGPCNSWCAMDSRGTDGCGGCCGKMELKLCLGSVSPSPAATTATVTAGLFGEQILSQSDLKCGDPKFPYGVVIAGQQFCYTSKTYALRRSGPCESWCLQSAKSGSTTVPDGCNGCCGDIELKLCNLQQNS